MKRPTFKNIKANAERIIGFHRAIKSAQKLKQQEAAKKGVVLPEDLVFDLDKALRSMQRKHDNYYGNTSKYHPHQGAKECARRLRASSPAWHSRKNAMRVAA
jgi:hypothetical protein